MVNYGTAGHLLTEAFCVLKQNFAHEILSACPVPLCILPYATVPEDDLPLEGPLSPPTCSGSRVANVAACPLRASKRTSPPHGRGQELLLNMQWLVFAANNNSPQVGFIELHTMLDRRTYRSSKTSHSAFVSCHVSSHRDICQSCAERGRRVHVCVYEIPVFFGIATDRLLVTKTFTQLARYTAVTTSLTASLN